MSLIEIDTALIFAGYLGFSILYKSGSVQMKSKHFRAVCISKSTMVLIGYVYEILLGKSY